MSLRLNSAGGGSVTLQEPNTASNLTLDLPAVSATVLTNRSAGTILQVVSAAKTDVFSTTSTSFIDVTGMSVTITPSSTSSRILILINAQIAQSASDCTTIKVLRGSTDIFIGDAAGSRPRVSSSKSFVSNGIESGVIMYVDSPSTTSPTVYKLQMRLATGTAYLNQSAADGDNAAHPRCASSITVMEIAG